MAHEALIRGWGRLREWIDADRAGLRIQRQLSEAAREWEANRRESSFLYGGTRLAVAREWAKTHRDALNVLEAEFLAASLTQAAQAEDGPGRIDPGGDRIGHRRLVVVPVARMEPIGPIDALGG